MDAASPWRGFLTAIAALAGLLGFASGSAALLGFAAGWFVVLGLAWLVARRGLGGLAIERRLPASAFEGDLITVDIALENHGGGTARFVLAEDQFGAGLAGRQSVLDPGPLPPLHRRILSYRTFVARQWGLYTVGPLSIGHFDPLGLFLARRSVPELAAFEVYPMASRIEAVALLGGRSTVAARDVTTAAAGQSLLFRGVRDFAAGDDVRRIHWPATARRGSPMVRENERDLQPVFTLFLDLERRGRAGIGRRSTHEYLVRVGASLLWTAHRRGDAFGLVAEADRPIIVPPGQGEAHLAAALHQLVISKQTGGRPLVEVVEQNSDFAPPGAAVVLFFSTTDVDLDAVTASIGTLRATGAHPLVIVVDALAFTPMDRPPTPVDLAGERRTALARRLVDLDVPSAILGPEDTPEALLASPDFLAPAPRAEARP
ncbi:MAG TPA: DUF58 domain-containing protein [Vicinamibacteria bacterium]|nr:DUF58 domain-containing protein [Vicinamibacteria bacterium]